MKRVEELAENIPGIKISQRPIVRWMFNKETEIGAIRRFDVNGSYAVVRLTGRKPKGLKSTDDVSFTVLPKLRNEIKAEQIRKKIKGATLADIATEMKRPVSTANALTMGNPMIPGAGREPKVVGAAFALENGQVSKLIDGESGVFKIEITKHTKAPDMDSYKQFAKDAANNINAVSQKVIGALKSKAEIEDNRASFY